MQSAYLNNIDFVILPIDNGKMYPTISVKVITLNLQKRCFITQFYTTLTFVKHKIIK